MVASENLTFGCGFAPFESGKHESVEKKGMGVEWQRMGLCICLACSSDAMLVCMLFFYFHGTKFLVIYRFLFEFATDCSSCGTKGFKRKTDSR